MKNSLTEKDTQTLIKTYQASLRQLEYQVNKTKATIAELEGSISTNGKRAATKATSSASKRGRSKAAAVAEAPAVPKVTRKRGRPRKAVLQPGEPTAPGNPKVLVKPKAKGKKEEVKLIIPKVSKPKTTPTVGATKGYRLSLWDHFVIDSITDAGKVLINSELLEMASDKNKAEKLGLDEETIRGKLVRSIHKLANKRGEIVKAPFPGKGHAYGLKDWFTKSGNLKKDYAR
ncbi:MAG: hypothetical protein AAGG75_21810 [Bacteroidota bacterium]